jgi:hypothetical protein
MGPRDYRRVCLRLGSNSHTRWGFLLCADEEGQRLALVTSDVAYVDLLVAGERAGLLEELTLPGGAFSVAAEGWPADWE